MMRMYDSFSPMSTLLIAHMSTFAGFLILLVLVDIALRGWALWRAARMGKNIWFIALLIVNSVGILPAIFLLLTQEEYERVMRMRHKTPRKRAVSHRKSVQKKK